MFFVILGTMKRWGTKKQVGFTIVELLIVVVVIAILAAVTIVAYNGIRNRAEEVRVQSGLSDAQKLVALYAVEHDGAYPASLGDVGVQNGTVWYEYSATTTPAHAYSITAFDSAGGSIKFYATSASTKIQKGVAPGHNLIPWDEPNIASMPYKPGSGIVIDMSEFRSSPASTRIAVSSAGKGLRISPITGEIGQKITVGLWIKSASDWNGTASNSKIRFGLSDGSLVKACGYNGVKLTWTYISCDWVMASGSTTLTISAGNDGTVGNIWIDDVSVTLE